ncbi:MAG: DUF4294 domain-containing protein [Bacteroidales bacterium]|nr:DUF4294 domain-containing protein [Bacteroidales bacterium]
MLVLIHNRQFVGVALLLASLLCCGAIAAQTKADATTSVVNGEAPTQEHYTYGVVVDGDTLPLYYLREVKIYSSGMLLTPSEIRRNAKLIRNVKLMLPYAREARLRLDALEREIATLPKKQRKAAIKQAESDLLAQYKGELSNYTFSQGLVLIKLIDRETNRTAYSIVGDLRGSLRAGLYQTFAKLFGFNLKSQFDPDNDKKDNLIDRIVVSIDRYQL